MQVLVLFSMIFESFDVEFFKDPLPIVALLEYV